MKKGTNKETKMKLSDAALKSLEKSFNKMVSETKRQKTNSK